MTEEQAKRKFLKDFEADENLAEKAKPLQDLVWEYRGVFGDTHLGTKEGIISHEVELGYTLEGLKPPKFMNQGPVKKEGPQALPTHGMPGV